MNNHEQHHRIPKSQSCYPRLSNKLNQSEEKPITFDTLHILNIFYSLIIGLVTAVATRNYIKYSKLIGILMSVLFFVVNRKLLKSDSK